MNADYWQLEKRKLVSELEQKIVGGKQFIALSDIERQKLPEILRISLRNDAREIFRDERPIRIIQNDRFDFSDPTFKNHIRILRDHLIEQVRFQPEEVLKTIRFTVTLCFDLMTRPFSTVKSMLFRAQPERLREEVIDALRGLNGDIPFVQALLAELENISKNYFSKNEYQEISERLQIELYAENPISSIFSDFEMLSGFYFEVYQVDIPEFSADLMYGMLVERGLNDYAASFLEERSHKEIWTLKAFQEFLERHLIVGQLAARADHFDEPVQYVEQPPLDILAPEEEDSYGFPGNEAAVETVSKSRALLNTTSDRSAEVNPESENGYMRFLFGKRNKSEKSNDAPASEKTFRKTSSDDEKLAKMNHQEAQKTAANPTQATTGENLGHSFRNRLEFDDTATASIHRSQLEYQPPGPYPSLHVIIDGKSQNLFIRKIFDKDAEAYSRFIERIETEESWKKVKSILNKEFSSRNISPYCRDAVKLSDLLFSRYFSKGRY